MKALLSALVVLGCCGPAAAQQTAVIFAPKPAKAKTQALSNVKQLATGFMLYLGENNDRFGALHSTSAARQAAKKYLGSSANELWSHAERGEVLFNTYLSGVSIIGIDQVSSIPMLWEKNFSDNVRAVGFLDGSARLVTKDQWAKIWKGELARRKASKP